MLIVIPFRAGGKSRLPRGLRRELALAMLGDVVEAAAALGEVRVVTDDGEAAELVREWEAGVVADPGGGQGAAVTAALAGVAGPCLVVNADLPCATRSSLELLAAAGDALVAARDGTTNALSLRSASRFAPLYGAGSAERFAALGLVRVSAPELAADVDTLEDLATLPRPAGPRTTLVASRHELSGSPT